MTGRDARAESVRIVRVQNGESAPDDDWLAVEEPLEILLRRGAETVSLLTTMRTPGHDLELAAGLLYAEGVLADRADALDFRHLDDPRAPRETRANAVVVTLREEHPFEFAASRRTGWTTSACGVCGRAAIDDLLRQGFPPLSTGWRVPPETLYRLPDALREAQSVFDRTGGLHATALFDPNGDLIALREDIGRHNATDKLIGSAWLDGSVPFSERIVLTSGRAGFEIVQKSLKAGVGLLASVGAPSSLAVDLALESGMTLIGFLRGERFNIYSAPERVASSS